jgi:DNA gyrase subunit A
MGRVARGVRGISLREGDRVVAMTPAAGGKYLLTVCERGYGKRTLLEGYPTKNRGGLGNITIKTTQRNGKVLGLLVLDDEDHVVIVTSQGKIIRLRAKSISVLGRNTQGVRMVSIEGEEKVVAIAKVIDRDVGADEAVDALETADASEVAAAAAADAEDPDTDPGTDSLGGDGGDDVDGEGGNGTGGGAGEEG